MAVYAIGDLQGCYDPFRRLLDSLRFEPSRDRLWLAGDLVNRGPKSLKTLRFVRDLGDAAITVLGNHDLHLLALANGAVAADPTRFASLDRILAARDRDELLDWLRHRPLAHYDAGLDSLLVHAGTHPDWSVRKTLARAAEVEAALQSDDWIRLLQKMYGNTPSTWRGSLRGYKRLRFIVNCLTRMRMLTPEKRLNFGHSRAPWQGRRKLQAWYSFPQRKTADSRVVFGHWSQLGLIRVTQSHQPRHGLCLGTTTDGCPPGSPRAARLPGRGADAVKSLTPFKLEAWIDAHREQLKPPVCNAQVFEEDDFIVMIVGGPNSRRDYHVDEGPELFYQIEGDMLLRVHEDGALRDIPIRAGEMLLLPPRVPHSPQRFADTVGLVVERKRLPGELDGFLWFCEQCGTLLYEEYLELEDIVAQLPPVFERFHASPENRSCAACGHIEPERDS